MPVGEPFTRGTLYSGYQSSRPRILVVTLDRTDYANDQQALYFAHPVYSDEFHVDQDDIFLSDFEESEYAYRRESP